MENLQNIDKEKQMEGEEVKKDANEETESKEVKEDTNEKIESEEVEKDTSDKNENKKVKKEVKEKKDNVKKVEKSSGKRERYQFNRFLQNESVTEEEKNEYCFYIRPYIPFWSAQSLLFDIVARLDKIPSQRERTYSRYVLEKLGRTWIQNDPIDKYWFDQESVFEELKEDLILRLQSKFTSKSTVRSLNNIPEFHRHRALILDCWMLYLHKNFKSMEHPVQLKHFPMWNTSKEFKFNLYVEVKRTLATSPLEEMKDGKRMWLKVDDIDNNIYNAHFKPTRLNTDVKILTTEQYVPPHLKKFEINDSSYQAYMHLQQDPIVVRKEEVSKQTKKIKQEKTENDTATTDKQKVDEDDQTKGMTSETDSFEEKIALLQKTETELRALLAEKENIVRTMNAEMEKRSEAEKIGQLEQKIAELQKKKTESEKIIAEKDGGMHALQTQMKQSFDRENAFIQSIDDKDTGIRDLKKNIIDLEGKVNRQRILIEEKSQAMTLLNDKIAKLEDKERARKTPKMEEDAALFGKAVEKSRKLEQKIAELETRLKQNEIKSKEALDGKEKNIFQLEQKLDSRQTADNEMKESLAKREKEVDELNEIIKKYKEADDLRQTANNEMKESFDEKKKEVDELKQIVEKYKETYEGGSVDILPFQDAADRKCFESLVEYVRAIDTIPQSLKVRVKAMEKWQEKITRYATNSDNLINLYHIKRKKCSREQKLNLNEECKMRLGHNQFAIDALVGSIVKYSKTKYSEEYLRLSQKLVQHCNRKGAEEIAGQSKLDCPEHILKMNVTGRATCNIPVEPMAEYHNKKYRELIDEDLPKDAFHDFHF